MAHSISDHHKSATHPMNIYKINPMVIDIDEETRKNIHYGRVIHTGIHSQTVLMAIPPNSDIGSEVHISTDQFIKIVGGYGVVELDGVTYPIKSGISINIPSGTVHNIINTNFSEDLKLYTVYSPPIH